MIEYLNAVLFRDGVCMFYYGKIPKTSDFRNLLDIKCEVDLHIIYGMINNENHALCA